MEQFVSMLLVVVVALVAVLLNVAVAELVSCRWLLVVLMSCDVVMLMRCVVARAVPELLLETKSRSGGRSAAASDFGKLENEDKTRFGTFNACAER